MRTLRQHVGSGEMLVVTSPRPMVTATSLLVDVRASLISSGTERAGRDLASASLIHKARARPDLVRTVVDRARRDGIAEAASAVRSRLDEDAPVGYSAAGVVGSVGDAVDSIRPGDRVVTAGAGHGDVQIVGGTMAARLPDEVSFEDGAFAAIAAVGLHGLRLADVGPGARVIVAGLGLIGQLTVRLAQAAGCDVAATDVDPRNSFVAADAGAVAFAPTGEGWASVADWSTGRGADAVLVTAATSSSEPMRRALASVRDRGTVVAVGDVGLDLDRRVMYEKELTVRVSRAYGSGRYDSVYEELGIDYPVSYEPWTIRRNLETVVGLLASGRLEVADLVTHRFPFDRAPEAYDVFDTNAAYLGILLEYEAAASDRAPVPIGKAQPNAAGKGGAASGVIGAGRFARETLLPAAVAAGFGPWTTVASAGGRSAVTLGERFDIGRAVANGDAVIDDPESEVVFVASRHDSHAAYAAAALNAGKHVFVEKPLALSETELVEVMAAWEASPGVLMVGFNRRWSPPVITGRDFVGSGGPIQIMYRVLAGRIPEDHWLHDRRQGGRLLGEVGHFVDTCNAIVGEPPRSAYAVGTGSAEALLQEDVTVTLDYESGSQALITYAAGTPKGAGKERIDILRGDRAAEINDFRAVTLRSGTSVERVGYKPADKGHRAELRVFREAVAGRVDGDLLALSAFRTTRTMFGIVEALTTGQAVSLLDR